MGLQPSHVLLYVVRPALAVVNRARGVSVVTGDAAERLVMGTGAQESGGFRWLHQLGNGPALGLWQMEPATYADIWINFLKFKEPLAQALSRMSVEGSEIPPVDELTYNLRFAAAMCRVHYLRKRSVLPSQNDTAGLAQYWKDHYNTSAGKGTPGEFQRAYAAHVAPLYAQDSVRA